jgi:aryl-alcohol dehydrogenase-like predicted oxidoreductase
MTRPEDTQDNSALQAPALIESSAGAMPQPRPSAGIERYRILGDSGIAVSPLCLGAMMLGPYGCVERDDGAAIVQRSIDAGINFIDTADVYSAGVCEEIVGKAIRHRRDDVVLATKFTMPMSRRANESGHSRKWMLRAVEDSLRRLGTDYIDLYQAHRPDPSTNVDELLGTLTTLIHQGKVRIIGSSTFPAHLMVEAQWIAERRNRERFLCEQPPYSLLARGIERDVLPVAQQYGLGVITWGPLAGGWLSGRFHREMAQPDAPRNRVNFARYDLSRPDNQRKFEAVEAISALAEKAGVSMPHLSIGFALNHPAVTSVLIGPRTIEHMDGLLGAADVTLDNDLLDELDAICPPGNNINPADGGYAPPAITHPQLRRRAPLIS